MQSKHTGLTTAEVARKLEKNGYNELAISSNYVFFKILLKQFQSPLIYILLISSVISFLFKDYKDAVIILLVLVLNTIIGFIQEFKAENSLAALQAHISERTKVIRSGLVCEIETREVVLEDIVVLESGRRVPSDGTILEAVELQIDEALLTGESEPVMKQVESQNNLVYKGTLVVGGTALYVTTATGLQTRFGKIAESLQASQKHESPLQVEIGRVSKFILLAILAFSFVVIAIGFWQSLSLLEMYKMVVALSVSLIPEGLLIAFTVTLSVAMHAIMKKGAIVKNLPAAEALGSIDILCVDKTGTLTKGVMELVRVDSQKITEIHHALACCNNENNYVDQATKKYLLEKEHEQYFLEKKQLVTQFFPFSSKNKYTAAIVGNSLYAVGAPEFIMHKGLEIPADAKKTIEAQAKQGYRVLAVGQKKLHQSPADLVAGIGREHISELTFLGLIFLRDPVKENVGKHIELLQKAGIEIKVITGDILETTQAVLKDIGVTIASDKCMSGAELEELQNGLQTNVNSLLSQKKVFYRVSPEQKLYIVTQLQSQGYKVGMMGDGVNDAPALKRAEIGISVDTATDVSKEVSDIVLLQKDLQTVVYAVSYARHSFVNLKKSMLFLLATSYSNAIVVVLALLSNLPLPITPIQILWVNLIEDGFPGLSFSFEKNTAGVGVMQKKSRGIFDYAAVVALSTISVITAVLYFGVYAYLLEYSGYGLERLRTMTLVSVSVSSLLFLFSIKTIDGTIVNKKIFNNVYMNASFLVGIGLLLVSVYAPVMQQVLDTVALSGVDWAVLCVLGVLQLLLIEMTKNIAHRARFF